MFRTSHENGKKTFCFNVLFLLSRYVKGLPFFNGKYAKGVPFLTKMIYKRVRGWTLGRSFPVQGVIITPKME